MSRRYLPAAIVVGLLGVVASAQRGGPPQAPRPPAPRAPQQFRSGVDLVHLDVSVLDRNRVPVRGLGPTDFTVLENGQPQQITVFTAVDLPDVLPPRALWMREIAPDVRTNDDVAERRLFLIVIDDAAIQADPHALKQVKSIARGVVDRFGPADIAAIVFTRDNRHSQDFTDDRARLLSAVDKFTVGFRDMGGQDDLWFQYSVNVVGQAVDVLSRIPDRRKSIIYIGQGIPVDLEAAAAPALAGLPESGSSAASAAGLMGGLTSQMSRLFRQAARANVTVYTVDACGLRTPASRPPPTPTCVPGPEVEYLETLAAATGGRAVVRTNDAAPGLDAIFLENSSYYLLGYQSSDLRTDGRFRRLEVRVNRPGVEVRTRSGYDAEKPDAAKRKAELAASPLGAALSGILPKSDLPMRLVAVPFAIPGKRESAVAVVLNVRQPIRETGARTVEHVDLQVSAYNADGKAFGSTRLRADVTVRAGATGLAEYEVLSRIDLRPGRYQLRIAAHVGSLSTSGSLYFDLDVPDVTRETVSLSGLVLSVTPGPARAAHEQVKGLLPVAPTAGRLFGVGDAVTAFARVYQGGKAAPAAVPVRAQLRNDVDELVMDRTLTIAAAEFNAARSADIRIDLPIGRLASGSYLLTLDSTLGQTTARRDSRFAIR